VTAGALGYLRGTPRLGDLVEGEEALAAALMGSIRREVAQVLRGLTPPGMVNSQHGRDQ
jgi:hypothetical protein